MAMRCAAPCLFLNFVTSIVACNGQFLVKRGAHEDVDDSPFSFKRSSWAPGRDGKMHQVVHEMRRDGTVVDCKDGLCEEQVPMVPREIADLMRQTEADFDIEDGWPEDHVVYRAPPEAPRTAPIVYMASPEAPPNVRPTKAEFCQQNPEMAGCAKFMQSKYSSAATIAMAVGASAMLGAIAFVLGACSGGVKEQLRDLSQPLAPEEGEELVELHPLPTCTRYEHEVSSKAFELLEVEKTKTEPPLDKDAQDPDGTKAYLLTLYAQVCA